MSGKFFRGLLNNVKGILSKQDRNALRRNYWLGNYQKFNFLPSFEYAYVNFAKPPPKGFGKFERKSSSTSGKSSFAQDKKSSEKIVEENLSDKDKDLIGDSLKSDPKNIESENPENIEKERKSKDMIDLIKKTISDSKNKPNSKNVFSSNEDSTDKASSENTNEDSKNDNKNNKSGGDKKSETSKQLPDGIQSYQWLTLVALFIIQYYANMKSTEEDLSYQDLKNLLEKGEIEKILLESKPTAGQDIVWAHVYVKGSEKRSLLISKPNVFLENLEVFQKSLGKVEDEFIGIEFSKNRDSMEYFIFMSNIGKSMAITALIIFMLHRIIHLSKQGEKAMSKYMNKTKNTTKKFEIENDIKIRFNDVAGLEQAKLEIKEFVDFLRNPEKYTSLGAKLPRGALLCGPPGTGKTLLAKAVAGESQVPFFYTSGSEFVEMYVGLGASRVREIFTQAKEKSPSIIFIDEIDAIGKKRNATGMGGNSESDNTQNQLQVEQDGFGSDYNVVVFAATNRHDVQDPALTRPGRFDRNIEVTTPDIQARVAIFKVHLEKIVLDLEVRSFEDYAKRLASLTPGFTGADIANLCNEAAIHAARNGKSSVGPKDFEISVERVMAGQERKTLMNPSEKKIVAVHESGHAIVSWFMKTGQPLLKLTIIPRTKGSLGYAQYQPKENQLQNEEELLEQICMILGGRCAEELFFGEVTTGAQNDLEKGYQIAHNMVTKLGWCKEVGNVNLDQNQYGIKNYSDKTNSIVDQQVRRIIGECTEKCRMVIKEREVEIKKLSDAQLVEETLDLKRITEILGERPYPMPQTVMDILNLDAGDSEKNDEGNVKGDGAVMPEGSLELEPKLAMKSNSY